MEPRKFSCGSRRRSTSGRQHPGHLPARVPGFRRGLRAGHAGTGVSQEPGRPCHLRPIDYREGEPGDQAPAHGGRRLPHYESGKAGTGAVLEGEGNEAREDGWQGVGASNIICEAGKPTRRDPVEGRGAIVMEPLEGNMQGTSRPENVSARLQRVATLSKEAPEMVWTTLAHHIDLELLKEAYRLTRKDGAVGVDGQTAKEYKENLEENLLDLLNRFKSGT